MLKINAGIFVFPLYDHINNVSYNWVFNKIVTSLKKVSTFIENIYFKYLLFVFDFRCLYWIQTDGRQHSENFAAFGRSSWRFLVAQTDVSNCSRLSQLTVACRLLQFEVFELTPTAGSNFFCVCESSPTSVADTDCILSFLWVKFFMQFFIKI